MTDDQKLKIANALIEIKLALNELNRIIDKNNIDALNDTDLISYDQLAKGFDAVAEIAIVVRGA